MLVDSHCHLDRLDLTVFHDGLDGVLAEAKKQGIEHILCVCIDLKNYPAVLAIAEQYEQVSASIGVHPTEMVAQPSVKELAQYAKHPKVIALGETGLDYYRDDTDKDIQKARFQYHIQAAKEVAKPLIVHTRKAKQDTLAILKEQSAEEVGGVMHCFTEDVDMALAAIDLNFYISFSGIITFHNAESLRQVVSKIPLERILIETDAPYLTPVPYRGKPNQPAYVHYVAEKIAQIKNISYQQVAEVTTKNFYNLFKHAAK